MFRFLTFFDWMHSSITVELSLTRTVYNRYVFGVLDFASQLGGLLTAISSLAFFFVATFQFGGAANFVMSDLYRFEPEAPPDPKDIFSDDPEVVKAAKAYTPPTRAEREFCEESEVRLRKV